MHDKRVRAYLTCSLGLCKVLNSLYAMGRHRLDVSLMGFVWGGRRQDVRAVTNPAQGWAARTKTGSIGWVEEARASGSNMRSPA